MYEYGLLTGFVFEPVKSNAYLFRAGDRALIIDPHRSDLLTAALQASGIRQVTVLLTHSHYDHTCGIPALQSGFDTEIVCQRSCGEAVSRPQNNRPIVVGAVLRDQGDPDYREKLSQLPANYSLNASLVFDEQLEYRWADFSFQMIATPGHTPGSCCIVCEGTGVFTGDSLLYNTPVITRFPGGCETQYREKTLPFFKSLPPETMIYPGHGKPFVLKDCRLPELF